MVVVPCLRTEVLKGAEGTMQGTCANVVADGCRGFAEALSAWNIASYTSRFLHDQDVHVH